MAPLDRTKWGGKDRLSNLEDAVDALNGGSLSALHDLALMNDGPVTNVTADPNMLLVHIGTALTIQTGYAANDIVEPSILYDSRAPFFADVNNRNGYEYVLCACPYLNSDDQYENPCLWASHDGNTWLQVVYTAGIGVVNTGAAVTATPVVPTLVQGDGKNSDGQIYRGPDGTYYIVWNQALVATGSGGTGTGGNDWATKTIKASSLAGPWSTPTTIIASVKATSRPSSPSMFYDGTTWHLYAVDLANTSATAILHYTNPSTDPSTGTWVKQTNPTIALPTGYTGQVWWHLNAYRWGSLHLLIVQDTAAGASSGGNLWALTSSDGGVTWTVPLQPMLPGTKYYRSAMVVTDAGAEIGFDLFYGLLDSSHWSFLRTNATFGIYKYGGVNPYGSPIEALLIAAARIPISPYVFGDAPVRADSATTPSPADSGQTYTVSTGTAGVSSNQLYAAVQPCRAALTLTGCADGVYTARFNVLDTTSQCWLIARYTDASNYVRIGYSGAATWRIQNIVAGSVVGGQDIQFTGAPPVTAGDFLAVVCKGATITLYVNGRKIGSVTGWTSNQSGSGVGYQMTTTVARLKNLSARPLVQSS